MRQALKKLSVRPNRKDDRRTDVLSELLDTLRLATLVHGRFELGAPWGIEFPKDDVALLVVVVRGGARLEGEGTRSPRLLSAGDVALLPHGGAHRLRDAEASALRVLDDTVCKQVDTWEPIRFGGRGARTTLLACTFRFRGAHRTHSIQRLARCIHMRADDPQAIPWLRPTVQLLAAESVSRHPGATVVMNRLADVLLVQMIRAFIAGTECKSHMLRALADPPIANALALIHERLAEPWTVESMASEVALSRSGFAARFSALVGEPPLEYLARWRMTKAAQLLREGQLTMSEVATRAGYGSEASFNKAFKRLEGITPGTYRRRHRSKPGRAEQE